MRKWGTIAAAGAMLLSSTAAMANEGALPAGQSADVHQAGWWGMSTGTTVVVVAIIATAIVIAVTDNSSNSTT